MESNLLPELTPSDRQCPFCGGNRLRAFTASAYDAPRLSPAWLQLVECRECDAAWQFPIGRSLAQSIVIFDEAYASQADGSYFDLAKRQEIAQLQRGFLVKRTDGPGRLLDIGCGDGCFAKTMAAGGWLAVGVDPALPPHSVGDEQVAGLTLIRGSISDLSAGALFDVVTLWDVVEHVANPTEVIAAAVSRLAPGGLLAVETGNWQSAGRIESGGNWWNCQLDHRWYLGPPQLERLLRNAGLVAPELADRVFRPWWRGRSGAPKPRWRSLLKAVALRPNEVRKTWRLHSELVRAHDAWPRWSGIEIMTMLARKPH